MQPTPEDEPHPPPAPTTPIELELIDPLNLLSQTDHSNMAQWAAAVFDQLHATGSVRAKVVNDDQMSAAHKQFSGIEGTTDVLTFDLNNQDSSTTKALDTDLLICYDEAARQSKAQSSTHTPAHELLLYIIHGTLHCLGYDDQTPESFAAIHAREDQLLIDAGIGPLFDTPSINKGTRS